MGDKTAVAVVSAYRRFCPFERTVRHALLIGLRMLKLRGVVEAYLVDDRTMRRLNRRYRGKDKVANVLSFSWPKRFIAHGVVLRPLGEIYMGPDVIRRRGEDLAFLAVHGLLHLAGYDHAREKDRKRMEAASRRIMKRVMLG